MGEYSSGFGRMSLAEAEGGRQLDAGVGGERESRGERKPRVSGAKGEPRFHKAARGQWPKQAGLGQPLSSLPHPARRSNNPE